MPGRPKCPGRLVDGMVDTRPCGKQLPEHHKNTAGHVLALSVGGALLGRFSAAGFFRTPQWKPWKADGKIAPLK